MRGNKVSADKRRPDETFAGYRARLKIEAIAPRSMLGGTTVTTTAMNRAKRRDIRSKISADDAVVLAKICEFMEDKTPLAALQLLYDSKTTEERKTMILKFREIINEGPND
jgi:hypothetical protein